MKLSTVRESGVLSFIDGAVLIATVVASVALAMRGNWPGVAGFAFAAVLYVVCLVQAVTIHEDSAERRRLLAELMRRDA